MDELLDEKTYETRVLKHATASQRIIAWCIDVVLLLAISFSAYQFFPVAETFPLFVIQFWYYHITITSLYFIILDGNESQGTVGKKLVNLRMLKENKQDITMKDAAIRFFLSVILCFGFVKLFSENSNQTLAEKISKTLVIQIK